ncbi:hypothetical protein, partial [Limosilactobacillus fermentum]|uniref:hypothetical protein n=1 Tax=Limosilactobacillus fermentum TaxID=1613 RepID=UPI0021A433E9
PIYANCGSKSVMIFGSQATDFSQWWLTKHAGSQALAKERIGVILEREQATGLTKVKLALRQPVAGRPCFELRCNLAKLGSVRVAFTLDGQVARIWFISTSLQKATFTSEVSRVLREVSK